LLRGGADAVVRDLDPLDITLKRQGCFAVTQIRAYHPPSRRLQRRPPRRSLWIRACHSAA
jgi:hypothetical protein